MDVKGIRGTLSGQKYVRDRFGRYGKFPMISLMCGIIYASAKYGSKPKWIIGS